MSSIEIKFRAVSDEIVRTYIMDMLSRNGITNTLVTEFTKPGVIFVAEGAGCMTIEETILGCFDVIVPTSLSNNISAAEKISSVSKCCINTSNCGLNFAEIFISASNIRSEIEKQFEGIVGIIKIIASQDPSTNKELFAIYNCMKDSGTENFVYAVILKVLEEQKKEKKTLVLQVFRWNSGFSWYLLSNAEESTYKLMCILNKLIIS
jgi:hypothetical protein